MGKNPLQNIQPRKDVDGDTVYRVRIHHKGNSYSATRDTLSEAAAWRDDTKYRLKHNIALDGEIPQGDMTLGKATDKFIQATAGRAASTVKGYIWSQRQLLKYFGEYALLSSITQSKMYEYVSHRQNVDQIGSSKLCQELSFVKMVYETARAWDIEIPSPERNIKRPKKHKKSREEKLERVVKEDELIPFLSSIRAGKPHKYITAEKYQAKYGPRNRTLYLYLVFLLHTGMRPSEAVFLRWEKPSAKTIKEARGKKTHAGYLDTARGGFANVGTKTEPRFVPAHPVTINIIDRLQKEMTGQFIFLPDEHGQKMTPYRYYRSAFETARSGTILEDGTHLRENIDFYSFRHTARSRMAVCGVQDSAAENIIGHEGDKMQAVYTHYEDQDLIQEIKKLDYPWLKIKY